MNRISDDTRRNIFTLFIYGISSGKDTIFYRYSGRLSEYDFLNKIYDLGSLPSHDRRYANAGGDIWQHTVRNDDFERGWVFDDDRFQLLKGPDEVLLRFLCNVFDSYVRDDAEDWNAFLIEINALLKTDGYELYPIHNSIGRDSYRWKTCDMASLQFDSNDTASVSENGLRKLLDEAEEYYRAGNKGIAVEKIWDAFERMKTYYADLKKSASAERIISDMSGGNLGFKELYDTEFRALTNIGNRFCIRHYETDKIDITDDRQYEYLYKRCVSLISVAIQYLQ